ncbi:MAG: radical SAM protein [Saprospiraceae bacterium]|nr:radical SAM protein [Candidatus Vicinibacter affinis]
MKELLLLIYTHYDCLSVKETTLEANPDDLNPYYLDQLLIAGIDRLSIGVQSFYDHHLEWMNRSHNATQSLNAIQQAKIAGFTNLSADLIFGIPLCTDEEWLQNLGLMKANELPHLSCYALTVEEKQTCITLSQKTKNASAGR